MDEAKIVELEAKIVELEAKIVEVERELAELKETLKTPISEGERIAIRNQITAATQQITSTNEMLTKLYGLLPRNGEKTIPRCLVLIDHAQCVRYSCELSSSLNFLNVLCAESAAYFV